MSEALTMPLDDTKKWLEHQTSSLFTPVHSKAEKMAKEMGKTLQNLAEASKMLLENSEKEIEKKNAKTYKRARALNKLARLFVERIHKIKVPDHISHTSLSDFAQETQQVFITIDVDVRNWFPRISPFFIMDRRKFVTIFEKTKESLKELGNFLTKEYVKTKKLEETFQKINTLKTLLTQLNVILEEKTKIGNEKISIEQEITQIEQKRIELEGRGGINQLNKITKEIEALSTEVRHTLQHLQKPFIKLQALSLHGGGSGLTHEEVSKLNQYLENPFDALATESIDYPMLKQILQKLTRMISEGKIQLKPDKSRKAEQAIANILNQNSLENLHRKCVATMSQKNQLSTSAELTETKARLSKLEEQVEILKRRREGIDSRDNTAERNYKETQEKIRSFKSQIENEIFAFLNKRIHIE